MAYDIITPSQARAQGLTRYYTGVPCKNGHLTLRRTHGGVCNQCYLDHCAKRRSDHRNRQSVAELPEGMIIGLKGARLLGYSHYFTGKPCARGHLSRRQATNGTCMACDKANSSANGWHIHNREKANENARKWSAANPDRRREIVLTCERKRRAAKLNSPGTHTAADLRRILKAQGNRCGYCRADLRRVKKHLDHVMPLSRGGSNGPENLIFACATCNLSKSAKHPLDFARERGLLL